MADRGKVLLSVPPSSLLSLLSQKPQDIHQVQTNMQAWEPPREKLPWPICRNVLEDFCCCIYILEDFPGDFPGGFFWALFPTKMRRKNPARKSAKKSGGPKIKIREKSVLPKAGPKRSTLWLRSEHKLGMRNIYHHRPESKKRKSSEANSGSIHPYGRYGNAVKTRKIISTIAILWPVKAIFEKRGRYGGGRCFDFPCQNPLNPGNPTRIPEKKKQKRQNPPPRG